MSARIERVGVVGCGLMGAGVAEVSAKAGLDVVVAVTGPPAADRGRARITASLDKAVAKGRLTASARDDALGRVRFAIGLEELADRQLVVEAVREDEPLKLDVFAMLDKVVEDADAILATNTSSLPISRLAGATLRPSHVVGVHFFNPVPVLPLVELVGSVLTGPDTLDRAEAFLTGTLGKTAIRTPDRAGFVVNALLFPYLLSAVRMVESGVATAEVVDRGMELGCAHPLGPLRLADLIGLDTTVSIARAMHAEFKEPLYAPPPLLLRMVESGLLGRKSGRGFYEYA
ncbi:3-hydroxybutyryl-CoA dehydrogenase [Saccharothrix obliqua]|uniref:3-hydroxybutyryl-CoA dehydrogenase n=1 Tax=Saccharothrix obliqua TaxID=2861747 RepID=UPI001C6061DE|nr:3-hydroxybutyryl-CoA dehydrogenase [Saccharothrix obliqua]MBW4721548.1 3-hydroxybutyryl-CoA dehydrogenase [Saccharothrix obliqua]